MYIYKEKNKFPHIIYINARGGDPIFREITYWLKDNIGVYRKDWLCPTSTSSDIRDHKDFWHLWAYAFKTIESAAAFKLMWSDNVG